MAETKVEQLARETQLDLALVKKDVEGLRKDLDTANPTEIRERLAVLEGNVVRLEKAVEEVKHVSAILDRLSKLEEEKRESYKRVWQFFFLLGGVVLGVVGNLIVAALKSTGGTGQPK